MEVVSLHFPEQKFVALRSVHLEFRDCAVAGKGTVENQPVANHQTESERDDREEESLYSQRWDADDERSKSAEADADKNGQRHRHASGELHGEIAANRDEPELAQRQLPGPAGKDSDGKCRNDPDQDF
ncbi:unannotated protein [freshwater metagenome]|uniref:Unannotated protein n=1 Tax=freshwater metagenome TaxID=449393 RepID=A0A6J7JGE9_9ZZZZ